MTNIGYLYENQKRFQIIIRHFHGIAKQQTWQPNALNNLGTFICMVMQW
jgi:hypothetical protein